MKNGSRDLTKAETKQLLATNFEEYARSCLMIRTKSEALKSLELNVPQKYIHKRLEEQRKKTGKVRALILKGRQQGCSTYVEARFMWRVTHSTGVRAFILTHLDEATTNIFNMAKRYYDHLPDIVKPATSASNAKELVFSGLDSGYKVGTAKSQGTGRSDTIQFFHGSEVAFWHNAESHFMGAIQAVPNAPDTEIILESTANGMGGRFHDMVKAAIAGMGEYQLIFIPWYWTKEYSEEPPKGFELTNDEKELSQMYGLSNAQLMWRRKKIVELGSVSMFKQEYPCNPQEAFMFSGQESFITIDLVERAAKSVNVFASGERVLGVDVATGKGDDKTAFTLRQGRVIHWTKVEPTWGPAEARRYIMQLFEEGKIDRCNIDENGVGYGLVDELKKTKWHKKVFGYKSQSSATRDDKYHILRDEMHGIFKEWLENIPCKIPDNESLKQDIVTPGWHKKAGRINIESKDDVKKRIGRSTDHGDSAMLTTIHINEKTYEQGEIKEPGSSASYRRAY